MKKKNIFLMCILCCMTLLFSGCPDSGPVLFGDSIADNKIAAGSTVPINVTFVSSNIEAQYGYYTIHVVNEDNVYLTNDNTCNPIPATNKTVYNLDAKNYKIGTNVKVLVTLYTNYRCNRDNAHLPITDSSNVYTIVDKVLPNTDHLTEVVQLIGGESNYCNLDANGNYALAPSDNLFVRIAYSQVGYKEKASNKNLNSCTGNSGSGNYQKYESGSIAWCAEFIAWAIEKSGGSVPFTVQTDAMKTWAKNQSRWYTDSSKRHEGDIVKYNGHVGILYKNDSGSWRLIHGNWNNKVVETGLSLNNKTLEGYISMKGITY